MTTMRIGNRLIGDGQPCYVIAEAGQNHNGDLNIAKRMIQVAKECGADAVKFQKRTLEVCIPNEQQHVPRETPWGTLSYIDYRRKLEFDSAEQWIEIDRECRRVGIDWFASCWDVPAVDFIERFEPVAHKVASACVTDLELLKRIGETGRPVIVSTGACTFEQIDAALDAAAPERSRHIRLGDNWCALLHCNSSYPCENDAVNLRAMGALWERYCTVTGYSGHERGIQVSLAAVAMGAKIIERHLTLDRAMWGTDHAASLEPGRFATLVRDIRVIEAAMGDGVKRVTDAERKVMERLRRVK